MKSFVRICAATGLAACALAPISAQAKAVKVSSGLINWDGSIIGGGHGYTIAHTGTGTYTITFPAGSFKNSPVATCTADGIKTLIAICNVLGTSYNGDESAVFTIQLYSRSGGDLVDNAFSFTEITAPAK
jgi:hypothetical protein